MLRQCMWLAHKHLRNHEIFFPKVRLVDKAGNVVAESIPTNEAIMMAKAVNKNLFLINHDVPTCQIAKSLIFRDDSKVNETSGYSFDPTSRPATIQVSARIASEELEMKIDILRKHLLEKKRCELVVRNAAEEEESTQLISKILKEVDDIAKPASDLEFDDNSGEIRCKIWPCTPEQVNYKLPELHHIEQVKKLQKTSQRKRPKMDPKLSKKHQTN